MGEFFDGFRHVVRLLTRTPGTTIVAVLALALGIGVNTSSFISVNAVVLHPLPYPNLERIMTVWENVPKLGAERDAVAPANYLDWKDQNASFEQLAGYRPWDANLTGSGEPERIQARSYPVEVAAGQRVVQGPYVAETVPVTVEEEYVVVDV